MFPAESSRRRFLKTAFAFSAAALTGCGSGIRGTGTIDPVLDEPSHLLAIGDWGTAAHYTDQSDVAKAMQAYVARHNFDADALLMLGDNFYGDLPGGAADPRWQTQFETMYPASIFNCPAFAVPGNHDYQRTPGSKFDAELNYAAQTSTRWTMHGRYSRFTFPPTNPTTTVILLDSNMPNEPAQPPPPDKSYYTPTDADRLQQLAWLTSALQQPLTTPFLIVIGHHPLYSNGNHGDNATLIRDWDPLFRKAGVHLYLAGHDHDLQHLEFANHPTSFVTSGGGGAELNPIKTTARGPFGEEAHGFTHLQITPELMTVRHIHTNGTLLHKFTKTPAGVTTILT